MKTTTKKPSTKRKAKALNKHNVKRCVYGFELHHSVIDIEAESEQKALIILVKKFWSSIDDAGKIELLGERSKHCA